MFHQCFLARLNNFYLSLKRNRATKLIDIEEAAKKIETSNVVARIFNIKNKAINKKTFTWLCKC